MEQQQVHSSRQARSLSRRRFLAYTAAAAGAAALPGVSAVHAAPAGSRTAGRLALVRPAFEALVGSDFTLDDGRRLTLESVTDLPVADGSAPSRTAQHRFTVCFAAPGRFGLGQHTQVLHHAELGRFPLFLVPGTEHGGVERYTAVFNRL